MNPIIIGLIIWIAGTFIILIFLRAGKTVTRITYKSVEGRCLTMCPHRKGIMVGSVVCGECEHYQGGDHETFVECSHPVNAPEVDNENKT